MEKLKEPLKYPIQALTIFFILWKLILLTVAFLAPGPGYDTSTKLLFDIPSATAPTTIAWDAALIQHIALKFGDLNLSFNDTDRSWLVAFMNHTASRLVRWDAMYYVQIAQRGYLHEQEYAFGMGYTQTVSFLTSLLPGTQHSLQAYALTATILSIIAHYLSILILYRLTLTILSPTHSRTTTTSTASTTAQRTAFLASTLHILSPAGIFLAAPYAESLFALLNFAGFWAYTTYTNNTHKPSSSSSSSSSASTTTKLHLLPLAGLAFGAAATLRSNGVFSGLLFAYDVLALLPHGLRIFTSPGLLARGGVLVFSGLLVALGFATPQIIAYGRFCMGPPSEVEVREWCGSMPPSIYTFVQGRYWNVGFLHYWSAGNIPLFLLATPALAALFVSSWHALRGTLLRQHPSTTQNPIHETSPPSAQPVATRPPTNLHNHTTTTTNILLHRLALPQFFLAILALTVFHVQVITRLASGYPLLYIWAAVVLEQGRRWRVFGSARREWSAGKVVVGFAVGYALVQAGLFACFMPPA